MDKTVMSALVAPLVALEEASVATTVDLEAVEVFLTAGMEETAMSALVAQVATLVAQVETLGVPVEVTTLTTPMVVKGVVFLQARGAMEALAAFSMQGRKPRAQKSTLENKNIRNACFNLNTLCL